MIGMTAALVKPWSPTAKPIDNPRATATTKAATISKIVISIAWTILGSPKICRSARNAVEGGDTNSGSPKNRAPTSQSANIPAITSNRA